MNTKRSHIKWTRTLGNFCYMFGAAFLIAAMAANAMPAPIAAAKQEVCPQGGSWSGHQAPESFGQVEGAVEYCVKAGSNNSNCIGYLQTGNWEAVNAVVNQAGACGLSHWAYRLGDPTNTPIPTHTATPGDPTSTPTSTNTPQDPPETPTPTSTSEQPTDTPTPTNTPTATPEDPTHTPTPTETFGPGNPTTTPTETATATETPYNTQQPLRLRVSSFCGPDADELNWWKVVNQGSNEAAFIWRVMPLGAPADDYLLPGGSEYKFSTPKSTESDELYVYDAQENLVASTVAAQGCGVKKATPTEVPNSPNPAPSTTPEVLIPVTGANLVAGSSPSVMFLNLGLGFIGLGLVLNGLARQRKTWDL
jgi:outer membrane biosynthesis protein TonB